MYLYVNGSTFAGATEFNETSVSSFGVHNTQKEAVTSKQKKVLWEPEHFIRSWVPYSNNPQHNNMIHAFVLSLSTLGLPDHSVTL